VTRPGVILAAPASGSGKTLVTLGLLAALTRRGLLVASAKIGPDYIDPAFHRMATGRPCLTLDSWAMRPATLDGTVAELAGSGALIVCEGVMGLFDGAAVPSGADGSTADIAARTGWPVILVVDCRGMAASVAPLVAGFARARPDLRVAGMIANRVGGDRHRGMIAAAMERYCPEVTPLGHIPRLDSLAVPSRHLGLVQAGEHPALDALLDEAARIVETHLDLDRLIALARPGRDVRAEPAPPLPPLGQRIAVAEDGAFAFAYPAVIAGWRRQGAEIVPFSPLADQAPAADADAIYLPGGYPELHAGRLAANTAFLAGLTAAAARGAWIYGECGGYMMLGTTLTDAEGTTHRMAGLLPVATDAAPRRPTLGYRRAALLTDTPLGATGARFRGHEFHMARIVGEGGDTRLFACGDAGGAPLADAGHRVGRVIGSFLHLIDRES
jgi:cobyrinic acid a,c-diamide synthase